MNRVVAGFSLGNRGVKKQSAFTKIDFLKTRIVLKLIVLGVFVVVLSLFYIWSRIQIVQIGYEINDHKQVQRQLVEENKRLKMELSVLKAPQTLMEEASAKLNMKFPERIQVMTLE